MTAVKSMNQDLPLPLRGKASAGLRSQPAHRDHRHSALGVSQVLFTGTAMDMNDGAAQALTASWEFLTYSIDKIRVRNASTSLTTAVGGVKSGSIDVVATNQAYSALTAATLGLDLTVTAAGKAILVTADGLSLDLATAQGAAATADFEVWGVPLTE